jgi:hypothetical protein
MRFTLTDTALGSIQIHAEYAVEDGSYTDFTDRHVRLQSAVKGHTLSLDGMTAEQMHAVAAALDEIADAEDAHPTAPPDTRALKTLSAKISRHAFEDGIRHRFPVGRAVRVGGRDAVVRLFGEEELKAGKIRVSLLPCEEHATGTLVAVEHVCLP